MDAWMDEVSGEPCKGKGFRGGPFLDLKGSLQLLKSGREIKRCREVLWLVEYGMGFF